MTVEKPAKVGAEPGIAIHDKNRIAAQTIARKLNSAASSQWFGLDYGGDILPAGNVFRNLVGQVAQTKNDSGRAEGRKPVEQLIQVGPAIDGRQYFRGIAKDAADTGAEAAGQNRHIDAVKAILGHDAPACSRATTARQ